jgi:biopolymer transport protein ExbB
MGYLLPGPQSHRLLAAQGRLPSRYESRLADFMEGKSESVGLDISGGGALMQLTHQVGVTERLLSGGPLVWPILLVGLIALVLILERVVFFGRVSSHTDDLTQKVSQLVSAGDFESAKTAAGAQRGRPTGNVLLAGLAQKDQMPEVIDHALTEAMLRELPRLQRFLTLLKVLAAVAPLLGLLGTVTGMINTFQVITVFGTGDPRLMAGGISEALVTTQLGLAVAIPALIGSSLLGRKSQRILADMEEKAISLTAALSKGNRSESFRSGLASGRGA